MSKHLVSVAWLQARRTDPGLVIADVRYYLQPDREGRDAYGSGHIPGAYFVDLDAELSSPATGVGGRHPLPTAEQFAELLSRLGVTRDSVVVAYDDKGGAIAARFWWLLRYFGLEGCGRVLDGGIDAWQEAGLPLDEAVPLDKARAKRAPRLELVARPEMVVDAEGAARIAQAVDGLLLDARAAERYRGEMEPIDPRAGHIPGAVSAPWAGNVEGPCRVLLRPAQLHERFDELGALDESKQLAAYCGSGVTACHDLLALAVAGRDDGKLYVGSWSDWSSDEERPAAVGPQP